MTDAKQEVPNDIKAEVMMPAPDVVNVAPDKAIDRIGAASDANVQPIGALRLFLDLKHAAPGLSRRYRGWSDRRCGCLPAHRRPSQRPTDYRYSQPQGQPVCLTRCLKLFK